MWIIRKEPSAVSHSWMSFELRKNVLSEINGCEWPVPIPNDTSLERVRIELLNLGTEYVWLDVLCLRQEGGANESLRLLEWRLDVPTIGNVYHQNRIVVHYYSGLGRPFTLGDLTSERHWLNRAWTLQEISPNSIIGGETENSPSHQEVDHKGLHRDKEVDRFYEELGKLQYFSQEVENIFEVLQGMQNRASVNPVDKVAGVAYLLRPKSIPVYEGNVAAEDAWTRLVETIGERYRGDMLFLYPIPGDGKSKWRPSWNQILTTKLPRTRGVYLYENVVRLNEDNCYQHHGYCIGKCIVRGLTVSTTNDVARRGEVVVGQGTSTSQRFQVVALHQERIPEAEYVLVSGQGWEYWVAGMWVVGRSTTLRLVEKVSVLRIPSAETRDTMSKLDLGSWMDIAYI